MIWETTASARWFLAGEEVRRLVEGVGDRVTVADGKTEGAAQNVEDGQQTIEVLLAHGSSDEQGGVDEGKVARVGQEAGIMVVNGKAMSGAVHDANELGNRKEEVDELRNEEKHQGLGEVALDGGNSESHSGEISEGITDEGLRRVGIEVSQSQNATKEGEHEVDAVHVLLGARSAELNVVMRQDRQGNDDSLAGLQS